MNGTGSKLGPAPPGVEFVRGARGVILCREGLGPALGEAGFGVDVPFAEEALPDAAESGKEPLGKLVVAVPASHSRAEGGAARSIDALVRRFSHGGLARAFTGRRFKDPSRPFEELRLSEALLAASIPTPRVLAARAVSVGMGGFELALVTERLPGKVDLGALVGRVRRSEAPMGDLRRAIVKAARLIAAMHGAGFRHADLQPANLMVQEGGDAHTSAPGAWVLDLDRSEFIPSFAAPQPLPKAVRIKNLGRLWRHVRRREEKYGRVFAQLDLALFLRAYGISRAELPAVAREVEAAASSGGIWHRAGWLLDGMLGRGHDARAES